MKKPLYNAQQINNGRSEVIKVREKVELELEYQYDPYSLINGGVHVFSHKGIHATGKTKGEALKNLGLKLKK